MYELLIERMKEHIAKEGINLHDKYYEQPHFTKNIDKYRKMIEDNLSIWDIHLWVKFEQIWATPLSFKQFIQIHQYLHENAVMDEIDVNFIDFYFDEDRILWKLVNRRVQEILKGE